MFLPILLHNLWCSAIKSLKYHPTASSILYLQLQPFCDLRSAIWSQSTILWLESSSRDGGSVQRSRNLEAVSPYVHTFMDFSVIFQANYYGTVIIFIYPLFGHQSSMTSDTYSDVTSDSRCTRRQTKNETRGMLWRKSKRFEI